MISIRNGIWETNSSSVHSFTVDCDTPLTNVTIPKEVTLKYLTFGWDYETYHTIDDKITYILACLDSDCNNKYAKYYKMLFDFLDEYGIQITNLDTFKFGYEKDPQCYVESGYKHFADLIPIFEDKDKLFRFLFLDSSCIDTGNDNYGPYSEND